jgi:hypothetical protein
MAKHEGGVVKFPLVFFNFSSKEASLFKLVFFFFFFFFKWTYPLHYHSIDNVFYKFLIITMFH